MMIPPPMGCILQAALVRRYSLHLSNVSSVGFTPQIGQLPSHHTVAHVTKFP